jgi:hypothetical protein
MHSTAQISIHLNTTAVCGFVKERLNYEHVGTWNE